MSYSLLWQSGYKIDHVINRRNPSTIALANHSTSVNHHTRQSTHTTPTPLNTDESQSTQHTRHTRHSTISPSLLLVIGGPLEIKTANANRKTEWPEKYLQHLNSYLLRGGLLYGLLLPQNGDQVNVERPITPYPSDETYYNITGSLKPQIRKHRRLSDGAINRTLLMNYTNISNLLFTSPTSDSFKMETLGKTQVTCSRSITLSRYLISVANEALSLRANIVEQKHTVKEQKI